MTLALTGFGGGDVYLRASILILLAACTANNADRLCTPGNNVFCRCADLRDGTKKCSSDGASFAECVCEGVAQSSSSASSNDSEELIERNPSESSDNQQCPGRLVDVVAGQSTVDSDSTATGAPRYNGSAACSSGSGKERVYAFVATDSGQASVTMLGKGALDAVLYVREADCLEGTQVVCADSARAGQSETVTFNVIAGHKYYVFADGKGAGMFDLKIDIMPGTFCGDGHVDMGEACDDGNVNPGDGCSDTCVPDGDPLEYALCPGMPVHIWGTSSVAFSGSTTPYGASFSSSLEICPQSGTTSKDRVYAVVMHASGTLTIDQAGDYNGMIYLRAGNCTNATEVACANNNGPSNPDPFHETLSYAVVAGETYWLVVDGGGNVQAGSYTLTFTLN